MNRANERNERNERNETVLPAVVPRRLAVPGEVRVEVRPGQPVCGDQRPAGRLRERPADGVGEDPRLDRRPGQLANAGKLRGVRAGGEQDAAVLKEGAPTLPLGTADDLVPTEQY